MPGYFDGSRGWCKHLAALCFFLIAAAEEEPAHFVSSMGVCLMDMLNEDVIKKEEVAGDEGNPPAKRHRGPLAGLCGNHANDPVVLEYRREEYATAYTACIRSVSISSDLCMVV